MSDSCVTIYEMSGTNSRDSDSDASCNLQQKLIEQSKKLLSTGKNHAGKVTKSNIETQKSASDSDSSNDESVTNEMQKMPGSKFGSVEWRDSDNSEDKKPPIMKLPSKKRPIKTKPNTESTDVNSRQTVQVSKPTVKSVTSITPSLLQGVILSAKKSFLQKSIKDSNDIIKQEEIFDDDDDDQTKLNKDAGPESKKKPQVRRANDIKSNSRVKNQLIKQKVAQTQVQETISSKGSEDDQPKVFAKPILKYTKSPLQIKKENISSPFDLKAESFPKLSTYLKKIQTAKKSTSSSQSANEDEEINDEIQKEKKTGKNSAAKKRLSSSSEEEFMCLNNTTCGNSMQSIKEEKEERLIWNDNPITINNNIKKSEKCFCCEVCNKTFTRKANLTRHITIHSGRKEFQCHICHKYFRLNQILQDHLKCHEGVRMFDCSICQKSFTRSNHLKEHMASHDGIKEFQCHTCTKSFTQKSQLTTHQRIHSGTKDYICIICSKVFRHSGTLSKHMKIHNGIKDYKCSFCEKSFVENYDLKRHINSCKKKNST